MKPKLLFAFPYFYPKIGGAENYILNIAERLRDDFEIIILTGRKGARKVEVSKIKGFKVYFLPYSMTFANTPFSFSWYFSIKEILKMENPDIVNAHMPVPFLTDILVRIAPERTIITYHNDVIKEGVLSVFSKLYYLILGNATLRKAKGIIATSEYYVNISPYLQKHKKKISIVSPGVDLSQYNTRVKKGYLKNGKEKKIVFVGQLSKFHNHKGLEYLIQAISLIKKPIHLYVCGKGDNMNHFRDICRSLQIEQKVSFLGFVEEKDLPKVYRDADVVVLPTYNNAEGWGMVLAEANACGTPVIGTKVGGIPAVIEDGVNGLLVPSRDSLALAKAIEKVIGEFTLANSLGKNGAEKAKREWDWDVLAKKVKGVVVNGV